MPRCGVYSEAEVRCLQACGRRWIRRTRRARRTCAPSLPTLDPADHPALCVWHTACTQMAEMAGLVLAVAQLVLALYDKCKNSSIDFRNLDRDLKSFHEALLLSGTLLAATRQRPHRVRGARRRDRGAGRKIRISTAVAAHQVELCRARTSQSATAFTDLFAPLQCFVR